MILADATRNDQIMAIIVIVGITLGIICVMIAFAVISGWYQDSEDLRRRQWEDRMKGGGTYHQ